MSSDVYQSNSGEQNPHYGKPHSPEAKQKISQANKGRHHTEEAKKAMSDAKKGKPSPLKGTKRSEDSILRGDKHPAFGKKASEETKMKMREAHRKRLQKLTDEHI